MSTAELGTFDLTDEARHFRPDFTGEAGRRAETLIKTDRLRVVLVTMREGSVLHDHTAPGPITVQALRGHFHVHVDGEQRDVPAGTLTAIAANTVHAVHAINGGAFLLTIGWPPSAEIGDQVTSKDETTRPAEEHGESAP